MEIIEVRISHLAYAPEIAQAMLRRQQANAVVAARSRIVEGAVGMVELALHRLADNAVVELDEERKASMVSNEPRHLVPARAYARAAWRRDGFRVVRRGGREGRSPRLRNFFADVGQPCGVLRHDRSGHRRV